MVSDPPTVSKETRELELISLLERFVKVVKVFVVAVFVLFVLVVALGWQVGARNKTIDSFKDKQTTFDLQLKTFGAQLADARSASTEAKQAAVDSKAALESALAQSREGNGVDPAAVAQALFAITRIEKFLCGGECPSSN